MCKKILMTLLCGLLLAGCNSKQSNSNDDSVNSGALRIKVGDTFIIALESNPTTGYSWSLAESDPNIVKKVSNVYEPQNVSPGIVGSGGTEIWTFKAIGEGEAKYQAMGKRRAANQRRDLSNQS